jgi:hypothetical protein
MTRYGRLLSHFSCSAATALLGAASLPWSAAAAACNGPAGTPAPTTTVCVTAVAIPGNPLRSYDITWVNTTRSEFYLADRSNRGVDIISTNSLTFLRTIDGFTINLTTSGGINTSTSGPNGVVAHGNWLYAGDGNSTLVTVNLTALPLNNPPKTAVGTGGTTRVDEMAITTDGLTLLAVNNAENPPFSTIFAAAGDATSTTFTPTIKGKVTVSTAIIPPGFGLGIEQPTWNPATSRFYVAVPRIANNPTGCNYGQLTGALTCSGGMLVIDPTKGSQTLGPFDPVSFTGVVPLENCTPNGSTLSINDMLMLGCTATPTYVINDKPPFNFAAVARIWGTDNITFNSGDRRYYLGASKNPLLAGENTANCVPSSSPTICPVLGVVDITSVLLETIPISSGSSKAAADPVHNYIFVPQSAPNLSPLGGDTTSNGAAICGTSNGCVAVYQNPTPQTPTQTPVITQTQTQGPTGRTQSQSQSLSPRVPSLPRLPSGLPGLP